MYVGNYWSSRRYINNIVIQSSFINLHSFIDASTASVSVAVTDYNDETPVFIEPTLMASVAEEADFGTTITTLRVGMHVGP